ncbi:PepSY-associated TM helix domain-containing protein [Pedobacter jeongneungensis]|uniref:PepSY-associated TM helix domain-containing protein n=1 Tax=Pedobacter jeongneungensis TaxID=947309 RepID=UPI000560A81D|nr:PepSY-associated TM helix domain-containing protein [Pedobacter jeongneungensis]
MIIKPLKKLNAWLHLWLGLASGIVVVILGITGCILVFEQEIKSLSSPWLFAEKPAGGAILPPSKIYRSVKNQLPGKEIHSVWYHGENRSAAVTINSDSTVYVNPYTAKVIAMVHHEDFFEFIDDGHRRLWLPDKIGKQVIGWSTFIFFILLITGLILWWPKKWNKTGKDQSFKIKWKARFKRVNYDLHNVLGFYSLLFALIMAITGLIMSFSWFNKGIYWLTGGVGNPRKQQTEVFNAAPNTMLQQVDLVWLKVQNTIALYNKDQIIVSFPDEANEAIYACTDMINGYWRDLYFNPATLQLTQSAGKPLSQLAFADQVRKLNYSLHVGAFAGLSSKVVFFFASLICASLPITGFYIWWGKKKKKPKRKNILNPLKA